MIKSYTSPVEDGAQLGVQGPVYLYGISIYLDKQKPRVIHTTILLLSRFSLQVRAERRWERNVQHPSFSS